MRPKQDNQTRLVIPVSNLKVTNEFFAQYEEISRVLDSNPEILNLVDADLKKGIATVNQQQRKRILKNGFTYTSETVLRLVVCRKIEGLSYRDLAVRVDDSQYLRRFTRIYDGPMMDYSTLNRLECVIRPKTWEKVNEVLTSWAIKQGKIAGESLRLDTTAVETNIHHPTDSWLLWDLYRVLARSIDAAREIDRDAVGPRRLQVDQVKKLEQQIGRAAGKKKPLDTLKPFYVRLLGHVEGICQWARQVVAVMTLNLHEGRYDLFKSLLAEGIVAETTHFLALAPKVIEQARRRVILGEAVPNCDKIFSIFEEHTELLIRGKVAKEIEFGHMVLIGQVAGKFITQYDVFEKKPVEHKLLAPILAAHKETFKAPPKQLAADKGFYKDMEALRELEKEIGTVAIGKKGKRNAEETEREHSPAFRLAQRFRAGVEGTISFLKRVFGMFRVLRKGWTHFAAEIGAAVFAHNLVILARS
ncbi:MAG: ISNCY family transposase [Candidatus Eisenbacteria bacterium]